MKVSSYGWYPPEPHQVVHNDILRRHIDIVQVSASSGYIFWRHFFLNQSALKKTIHFFSF